MKTIKYLSIAFALILGISACELPDNVDPKRPTEVPISTLFTNAQVALVNQVDHVSVNLNISRLIAQYWQETTYFDEARYNFQDRKIPDNYTSRFYKDVLMDFKEAKRLLNGPDYGGDADEKTNMLAIIEILEVYAWHCIIDAFGDMPYFNALMGAENSTPVYDDAATVYADLLRRISNDIDVLNVNAGSFGAADLMYGGDVASWKKFGASLKLRLAMRLADVSPSEAKAAVEQAVAAGVFTSQDESGYLFYIGVVPHVNAIYNAYSVDNRKDYLPTTTIIDLMLGVNDPRLPLYFTLYEGEYVGAIPGLDGAQSYNNYSHFQDRFFEATFEAIMADYVEIEFLLAEAVERGFAVGGTAEGHYNAALEASILYWGGSETDVADYLALPEVAYGTATGNYKQKIGTQKYIALYNRGVEAWAEWRRLDYPQFTPPEGMVYGDIPKRMPYPYDEVAQNGTNYYAAVAKMGGTDDHRQPIFWDIVPTPY
ncbi:MAG: SusD/RagB family nutrient-binding outer membrane lipoprotein [Bacteroidales bacterium]|nr:SusD/RagB family nutrient-binding outer membrane lipoprotein [Bacteroidales bacterium]